MAVIDDFKADIRLMEGKRAAVYDDATGLPLSVGMTIRGNPTIGYGRALNKRPLSDNEIEFLLDNDASETLEWCADNLNFWGDLSAMRQRAVANMVYQIGTSGFLKFHDTIAAIAKQDWLSAHDHILQSAFATQTPARAQRVASMIRDNR